MLGAHRLRDFVDGLLGLVGILRTDAFDPQCDCLPVATKASSHSYSNEWRFPVNFWTESGRVTRSDRLLEPSEQ